MAKVTLIFALLLVALGLAGYYYTGAIHPTALIPLWWGLGLGLCGFLAIGPNPGRRKLFMHIAVTIGALGFIGALIVAIQGYGSARTHGIEPDYVAMIDKLIMAALLLIYVNLCVRSFIKARRSRQLE